MPAAAKIEKSAVAPGEVVNGKGKNASTNLNGNAAPAPISNTVNAFQDPQKIASTIIEKKVRNLEKRKVRLLEIKALEDKGQQLEAEQKIAVKKLDSVVEMIDMLKEIGKNVNDGLNDFAKQLKKQQKREQMEKQTERQQQDAERTKLWLNAQFVLSRFASAKNDLLHGNNGAVKLDDSQVEALEKLVELLDPSSVELIEASVEKVNFLLEGNKREFTTGVTYSVLKETLVKLIDSKYFETLSVSTTTVAAPAINQQAISSGDKEESLKVEQSESIPVTAVPTPNDSQETPGQEQVHQVKQQPQQQTQKQPMQKSQQPQQHHQLNQLCFMRDPVVENELQHKDPAVVAVAAPGGFTPYQSQIGQGLPTIVSTGANIAPSGTISYHYAPHMNPAVSLNSIPTQTFTNSNFSTIIQPNQFIPVTLPAQIPHHQMPIHEQTNIPLRNVAAPDASTLLSNEKSSESQSLGNNEQLQFSVDGGTPNEASNLLASQDSEGKPSINGQAVNGTENGHHGQQQHKQQRYNRGARGGANPRGNFGGNNPNGGAYRGGRGGKSFGNGGPGNANFFNGGNVNNAAHQQMNGGGNFNATRPTNNRQNGGSNRSGQYRQDRAGVPRNQNSNIYSDNFPVLQKGAPVSAK